MKRLFHFNTNGSICGGLVLGIILSLFSISKTFSNNLNVTIISKDLAAQTVTFDLSWNNSWRSSSTTAANWDAAWVFVKWRNCDVNDPSVQFTHGLISTTLSDHTFNGTGGGGSTTFEPTLADGSAVGIDPSPNNTGVMLRNFSDPVGPATVSARITLKVTNLPASGNISVTVFGIEMVFVPQGAYSLGDGNGSTRSTKSFVTAVNGFNAASVSSESAQSVFESATLLGPTLALTAPFPKGFAAFYIMKYEISEGAYVDFLNASSSFVQLLHYPNQISNRYIITNTGTTPNVFATTRQYRACNYLSWDDVGAYLDWAALRPLTELEYEKACRGTAPSAIFENAMGGSTATRAATIVGTETGSETISTAGANVCADAVDFGSFSGGDGNQGPLRGGIFATASNSTRALSGASFYGVLDLSGNVDEYYVTALSGTITKPSQNGLTLGDGILDDATGHFNTSGGWPLPTTPGNNIIHRGGHWNSQFLTGGTSVGNLNVSDRQGGATATRLSTSGGRGGRAVTGSPLSPPLTYPYTGAIETFTVPAGVTSLTIDAFGGGGSTAFANAGRGAEMKGAIAVTPGEVLQVLIGGAGSNGGSYGGGGGTFVVRTPYNTLASCLVAAGGGAGMYSSGGTQTQALKDGQTGTGGAAAGSAGGTNGTGGTGSYGGGGGGFLTNGTSGSYSGGIAYVNGGYVNDNGGFGGGGSSGAYGGGGGGYSGGGGASSSTLGGGGGGSIINGTTITTSQTGTAAGTNGKVIFSW